MMNLNTTTKLSIIAFISSLILENSFAIDKEACKNDIVNDLGMNEKQPIDFIFRNKNRFEVNGNHVKLYFAVLSEIIEPNQKMMSKDIFCEKEARRNMPANTNAALSQDGGLCAKIFGCMKPETKDNKDALLKEKTENEKTACKKALNIFRGNSPTEIIRNAFLTLDILMFMKFRGRDTDKLSVADKNHYADYLKPMSYQRSFMTHLTESYSVKGQVPDIEIFCANYKDE